MILLSERNIYLFQMSEVRVNNLFCFCSLSNQSNNQSNIKSVNRLINRSNISSQKILMLELHTERRDRGWGMEDSRAFSETEGQELLCYTVLFFPTLFSLFSFNILVEKQMATKCNR